MSDRSALQPPGISPSRSRRWFAWLETADREYPNYLATPAPLDPAAGPPFRPWLLAGLLLACLVPRALMAWKLEGFCPDARLYVHLAQAIEQGDHGIGPISEHLGNPFVLVLGLLHRAGLGWETAGETWGVLAASLSVLPLFGWIRRAFDDRVAILAALLYAAHPKFVEYSPEAIRDPTFWLLLSLTLYLLWRAVTEVRIGLFLLAGAAGILAAMTRFEGVFLAVLLVLWTGLRWQGLRTSRWRLAVAGAATIIVPLALALAAAVALSDRRPWQIVRTEPMARVRAWADSWLHPPPDAERQAASAAPPTAADSSRQFFQKMLRGYHPLFGLLTLLGMAGWQRTYFRRDHLSLWGLGLPIWGGIYVHLWYAGVVSSRYFLSLVLVSLPFTGLGVLALVTWASRLASRHAVRYSTQKVTWGLATCLLLVGWLDALSSGVDRRFSAAEVEHDGWEALGRSPSVGDPLPATSTSRR